MGHMQAASMLIHRTTLFSVIGGCGTPLTSKTSQAIRQVQWLGHPAVVKCQARACASSTNCPFAAIVGVGLYKARWCMFARDKVDHVNNTDNQ